MTYLKGTITTRIGEHRLHHHLNDVLIVTQSFVVTASLHMNNFVQHNPGDTMDFESCQFPVEIRLPVYGAAQVALANKMPNSIEIAVEPKKDWQPGPAVNQTSSINQILCRIISPTFADYYENHKLWLNAEISTDSRRWPKIWNFARVVRNAISHAGRINIDNPSAESVSWYNLTYGPAENGTQAIGRDILIADLIILMFEMDDELTRLGCPI